MPTADPERLDQFYRGKWWENSAEKSDFRITAWSAGLTPEEALALFTAANLGTFQRRNLDGLQEAYGLILANEERYLLLHVRPGPFKARGYTYPDYRCIVVPAQTVADLQGNLEPLWQALDRDPTLPALARQETLPAVELWAQALPPIQEAAILGPAFAAWPEGRDIEPVLSAILSNRPLAITGAPRDPKWRWAICQAVMNLLPPRFRDQMTFGTEVFDGGECRALLKFLYADPYVRPGAKDVALAWDKKIWSEQVAIHPYAAFVASVWEEGAKHLADMLHQESVAELSEVLRGAQMAGALEVLGGWLSLADRIDTGTLDEAEWPAVARLLGKQLDLIGQLASAQASVLRRQIEETAKRLVELGWGEYIYDLLARQPDETVTAWQPRLQEFALLHLARISAGGSEKDILQFANTVRRSPKLSAEFWPAFTSVLRNAATRRDCTGISLLLIELSLDHANVPDYRQDLQNPDTDICYPPQIVALRGHWFRPDRANPTQPGLLFAVNRLVADNRILVDLVAFTLDRKVIQLIEADVVQLCARQFDETSQVRMTRILNSLVANSTELDVAAQGELAWLLAKASRFDESVAILNAWYARSPDRYNALLEWAQRAGQTLPNTTQLEILKRLRETPMARNWDALFALQRSILDQTGPPSPAIPEDELVALAQDGVAQVLKLSGTWSNKAKYLNDLAGTRWGQRPPIRPALVEAVYAYARTVASSEELDEMEEALRAYPALRRDSRVPILHMLQQALGSPDLSVLEKKLTVHVLVNLRRLRGAEDWRYYQDEIRRQIAGFSRFEQQDFSVLCRELATLIAPPSVRKPEALGSMMREQDPYVDFDALLNALDQVAVTQGEASSGIWQGLKSLGSRRKGS